MNIQRLIAIAAAIAINVAVLAWFHNWSVMNVASVTPPPTPILRTLPVINVYPTAQQWRELRETPAPHPIHTQQEMSHASA